MSEHLHLQNAANHIRETGIWKQGNAEGKAEFILDTLSDYGTVPLGIREIILTQDNLFQLKRWFLLARQVRTVEEFINRM